MADTRRPTSERAEEILGRYFRVLDHGFVALVDYMGNDEAIEDAARVSVGAQGRKVHERRGLIRYLRRHYHTTPSEMVELKFHCSMPIFIARQWIRHRTASVNEMSGRYSILPMKFYMPEAAAIQVQSKDNKQGRGAEASTEVAEEAIQRWNSGRAFSADTYGWLTENDVAKELARIDLPLSLYTEWYWKIDLHNLLHFLRLRVDAHAQLEFREYGKIIAGMVERVAPLSYEAWIDYDVAGVKFSRMEMLALKRFIHSHPSATAILLDNLVCEGVSKREIDEFYKKIDDAPTPNFLLDAAQGIEPKDGELW